MPDANQFLVTEKAVPIKQFSPNLTNEIKSVATIVPVKSDEDIKFLKNLKELIDVIPRTSDPTKTSFAIYNAANTPTSVILKVADNIQVLKDENESLKKINSSLRTELSKTQKTSSNASINTISGVSDSNTGAIITGILAATIMSGSVWWYMQEKK